MRLYSSDLIASYITINNVGKTRQTIQKLQTRSAFYFILLYCIVRLVGIKEIERLEI